MGEEGDINYHTPGYNKKLLYVGEREICYYKIIFLKIFNANYIGERWGLVIKIFLFFSENH